MSLCKKLLFVVVFSVILTLLCGAVTATAELSSSPSPNVDTGVSSDFADPVVEELESDREPIAEDMESNPNPLVEELGSNPDPVVEELESDREPIAEDMESNPNPLVEELESNPNPLVEELGSNPNPIVVDSEFEESESDPDPIVEDSEYNPDPVNDEDEVNPVSESENSSVEDDDVSESQNYPSYTETVSNTYSEDESVSSILKVFDDSITSKETPHIISYSITNSPVDISHLGPNGTKVDISVHSDEKIRSIMFRKEGTDEYSVTLGGIIPSENDGVYSLEFVSGENADLVGIWDVYATFDSGSDEMIGQISVTQSEPVNSSDAEIKENVLSEELIDSNKAVPASPGFGIPVCLGVLGMLLIPALRRR